MGWPRSGELCLESSDSSLLTPHPSPLIPYHSPLISPTRITPPATKAPTAVTAAETDRHVRPGERVVGAVAVGAVVVDGRGRARDVGGRDRRGNRRVGRVAELEDGR